MLLLGIDCSHSSGSICLQNNSSILFHKEWTQQKSHAEFITQALADSFKEANINPKELNAIAVNEGPGSFTGLRIAINTARTLSYSFGIPIYPLNSLEITAHAVNKNTKPLLVALNAHSEMCYLATFNWNNIWNPSSVTRVLSAKEISEQYSLQDYVCAGDGFHVYSQYFQNIINDNDVTSSAILLNDLLLKTIPQRKSISWENLQPFYVRLSAPEEKLSLDQGQKQK